MNSGATGERPLDLAALIDERPVGRFQTGLLILLGASVGMDGVDAQAMGFVAPAIIRAWGVDKASLGPVFGASLMGMLVAIVGPIVAGRLIGWKWDNAHLFTTAAAPAPRSCAMLVAMAMMRRTKAAGSPALTAIGNR